MPTKLNDVNSPNDCSEDERRCIQRRLMTALSPASNDKQLWNMQGRADGKRSGRSTRTNRDHSVKDENNEWKETEEQIARADTRSQHRGDAREETPARSANHSKRSENFAWGYHGVCSGQANQLSDPASPLSHLLSHNKAGRLDCNQSAMARFGISWSSLRLKKSDSRDAINHVGV